MPEDLEQDVPSPADSSVTTSSQSVGGSGIPPVDKQGGVLPASTLTEALEGIVETNPASLSAPGTYQMMCAWLRFEQQRTKSLERQLQFSTYDLSNARDAYDKEKELRIRAEEKLQANTKQAPKDQAYVGLGIILIGFGISDWKSPLGWVLMLIGAILILMASHLPWGKK